MHQDYNIAKGIGEVWERMKYVRHDRLIGPEHYAIAHVKVPYNYVTVFRCKIRDLLTGEVREEHLSFGHDATLPRGVLEDMFAEEFESKQERYPWDQRWELISMTPVAGMRRLIAR
jgi:hypothetical protein